MPGVTTANIGDLVASVFPSVPFKKWVDVAQTYNNYHVLPVLFKRKEKEDSGPSLEWKVQKGQNTTARQTRLFSTDDLTRADFLTTATVPWTHFDTHYAYDEREWSHKIASYSNQQILDHILLQDHAMMMGAFDHFEELFFSRPTNAADDLNPYGLKYYVVRHVTGTSDTANGGLNGSLASDFTTVAGISPTTVPTWKNWTAKYTNVSTSDLVLKLSRAMDNCSWGRPRAFQSVDGATPDWRIYMPNDQYQDIKNLTKAQNEDVGLDLDPYNDKVMFRGAPIKWAAILDGDTDDPVYLLDLATWDIKIQKGRNFVRTLQRNLHGAHNVSAQWLDCSYNFLCYNRRRNAVLAKTATNA